MSWNHPTLNEMIKLAPDKKPYAQLAFDVYMELCEVRKWRDVSFEYSDSRNIFFFTAIKEKNNHPAVFVPIHTSQSIDIDELLTWQRELSPNNKSITLVIKDSDSTSTYYQISEGLIQPKSPEEVQLKHERKEHIQQLEHKIKSRKRFLYSHVLQNKNEPKATSDEEENITEVQNATTSDWCEDTGQWS